MEMKTQELFKRAFATIYAAAGPLKADEQKTLMMLCERIEHRLPPQPPVPEAGGQERDALRDAAQEALDLLYPMVKSILSVNPTSKRMAATVDKLRRALSREPAIDLIQSREISSLKAECMASRELIELTQPSSGQWAIHTPLEWPGDKIDALAEARAKVDGHIVKAARLPSPPPPAEQQPATRMLCPVCQKRWDDAAPADQGQAEGKTNKS